MVTVDERSSLKLLRGWGPASECTTSQVLIALKCFVPTLPVGCVRVSVTPRLAPSRSSSPHCIVTSRLVTLLGCGDVNPPPAVPSTVRGYLALYRSALRTYL